MRSRKAGRRLVSRMKTGVGAGKKHFSDDSLCLSLSICPRWIVRSREEPLKVLCGFDHHWNADQSIGQAPFAPSTLLPRHATGRCRQAAAVTSRRSLELWHGMTGKSKRQLALSAVFGRLLSRLSMLRNTCCHNITIPSAAESGTA